MERTLGGFAATQAFALIFMVHGMKHCFGGDGPSMIRPFPREPAAAASFRAVEPRP